MNDMKPKIIAFFENSMRTSDITNFKFLEKKRNSIHVFSRHFQIISDNQKQSVLATFYSVCIEQTVTCY